MFCRLLFLTMAGGVSETFPHEQTAVCPPPKTSWCSFCTAIFPPRDVFRCQRSVLSFIFICCGYRAAGRNWWALFVLYHTSEGPLEWSPQWIPLPTETRPVWWQSHCHGDVQVMGPNYTLQTIFLPEQNMNLFFCPSTPPPPGCVNVSTCRSTKVNTSLNSSRILSSIIKAASRVICIILSIRAGQNPAGQAMQNERRWWSFWRWHSDDTNSTGCIRCWWAAA